MSGQGDSASAQLVEGRLPVRPNARTWSPVALFGATTSAAVATWCFIGGGFAAYYLPVGPGVLALTAGTLLGAFFVIISAVPSSTRYGIEAMRSTRPTFGTRGSYITLAIVLAIMVGWNSVLTVFLGNASAQALVAMGTIPESSALGVSVTASLASLVLVVWLLRKGPDAVRDIGPIVASGIVLLSALIAFVLIVKVGPGRLLALPALEPHPDPGLNLALVVELGVAGGLSWWPYVGTLTRYSRSTRGAIAPAILGLGWMMSAVLAVGLMAAVAAPHSGGDPTMFLIEVGGPSLGVVALLFIVFANVGTAVVGVYVSALSLKQVPTVDRRIGWRGVTVLVTLPVALIVAFFPGVFLDYYQNFLAFIGVLLGPICGVQVADYYFVRRQNLNLRALYAQTHGQEYWYQGGFNLAGVCGLAAGMTTYLLLLNPLTYMPNVDAFKFLTASIPAILTAGIVYLMLMRVAGLTADTG